MPYMTLVYKGAGSDTLYTAYFDGTKWHGNTKISSEPGGISPESNYNPGTCLYLNRFYLIYKGAHSNDLYTAWNDGFRWYGNIRIKDQLGGISPESNYSPSLVVYRGLIYAVYKGAHSNDLYLAWFDGTQWFGNTRISSMPGGISPKTNYGLDAVVYKDRLYLVYKGESSNTLYSAWFDGQTWSGNTKISDQPGGITPESNYNPDVCVFNDRMYLVYKGAHSNSLYTAYFDGASWHGNTKISDQPGGITPESNYNPGSLVFENALYLTYKGAHSNTLYTAYFDGASWHGNTKISDQPGGITPESNYNPEPAFLPIAAGNLASWMLNLSDDELLCDISLPGTHDSAAINSSIHTPYACHYTTLTQQMEAGARMLDIRISVNKSGSTYSFMTCHGDVGDNEYQSLSSAFDEFASFLQSNRSEALVVSLKVDDWNGNDGSKPQVYQALIQLLTRYPILIERDSIALRDARSRIYLLNRITSDLQFGVPIAIPDNTKGQWVAGNPNRGFDVYVQDRYEDLPFVGYEDEKLKLFTDAIGMKAGGMALVNFASATYLKLYGVYIMGGLLRYLGKNAAKLRPQKMGWSLFDYETTSYQTDRYSFVNCLQLVVSSNFGYQGFENAFKVISDGRDEL